MVRASAAAIAPDGVPSAVIVPVSEPVGASWTELRDCIRDRWSTARACAKWMAGHLYAQDGHDRSGLVGLAPLRDVVAEAALQFPALSPDERLELVREVQRHYRAAGAATIWTRSRAIPLYRYPVAPTIPPRSWFLQHHVDGCRVCVRLGDRAWVLRLDAARAKPSRGALRQFEAPDVRRGRLAIYESAGVSRSPRFRNRRTRIMLRLGSAVPGELEISAGRVQRIG